MQSVRCKVFQDSAGERAVAKVQQQGAGEVREGRVEAERPRERQGGGVNIDQMGGGATPTTLNKITAFLLPGHK